MLKLVVTFLYENYVKRKILKKKNCFYFIFQWMPLSIRILNICEEFKKYTINSNSKTQLCIVNFVADIIAEQ